jgi:glucosylglycerate synthase
MAEPETIRKDLLERIKRIGSCEILVGIPSYNNAGTIGHVVESVRAGLEKYFHGVKAVLVNADGGSMDGTPRIVAEAAGDLSCIQTAHRVSPRHKLTAPYHGIPGRGNALRAILEIGDRSGVRACAVVGADLVSLGPDWIERLLTPIWKENYAYVAPHYLRHKYDGSITNFIVYPLLRALYGKRIRQPMGSELACSAEMIDYFLAQKGWDGDTIEYGTDLWLATAAVRRGARLCQARLGACTRMHKDAGTDLSTMLAQVVGSLFALLQEQPEVWKEVRESEPVPLTGAEMEVELKPVRVNVDRMIHAFHLGVTEFRPMWEGVLSGESLAGLSALAGSSGRAVRFPDSLWVKVLYDFVLAVRRQQMSAVHLLKSMTPLYLGKTASFILETAETDREAAEDKIEQLCRIFEREKPYLVERWDKPEPPEGK